MTDHTTIFRATMLATLICCSLPAALAASLRAAPAGQAAPSGSDQDERSRSDDTGRSVSATSRSAHNAAQRVSAALDVVPRLAAEPRIKPLLQQAKGLLIVPSFGRVALGLGAHGGAGVLLLRKSDGSWSGPAFYNVGGLSLGVQAGAEGGAMALVLNNDKAVEEFMKKNNFALSAEAGLTVLNWSRLAQGSAGTGDVVAWSGTRGLFGDAVNVGLSDIRYNQELTNAYYGRTLAPHDIAQGNVTNTQAQPLQQALAQAAAAN
jgi:lipid-binding SYLF domain-containing protein